MDVMGDKATLLETGRFVQPADFSESTGDLSQPKLNKEPLTFEYVHPSQRSYK